jgi:hypothetical protein
MVWEWLFIIGTGAYVGSKEGISGIILVIILTGLIKVLPMPEKPD